MSILASRRIQSPEQIVELIPIPPDAAALRDRSISEIKAVLSGQDDRFLLVIGPCSADRSDAVLEYMTRLAEVREKVRDSILIVPRIYTNKPRTVLSGYKGMLHQPAPLLAPDMCAGLGASRRLHLDVLLKTGFACADELLYPELLVYFSDLLSYAVIGARSVENQQHRLVASAMDIPVGMKNPMSGSLQTLLNSVRSSQSGNVFIYRDCEVTSSGNEFTHAILRGSMDNLGSHHPNFAEEELLSFAEMYEGAGIVNPAAIVDCNHSNSGKDCFRQAEVAFSVMQSRKRHGAVASLVKGLMIESYLEDGCQKAEEGVYGKSITDPCLGWEKTERLIYDLAGLK